MDDNTQFKYMEMLQQISNREHRSLAIDLEDLQQYCKENDWSDFYSRCRANATRASKLLSQAADDLMPEPGLSANVNRDVFDVLLHNHMEMEKLHHLQENADMEGVAAVDMSANIKSNFPPQLTRRYEVYLSTPRDEKVVPMRAVTAQHLGSLVKIKGVVTHCTDVKPMVAVATYLDMQSGIEVFQEVLGPTFLPITTVPFKDDSRPKSELAMQMRGSKLIKFQQIKLQEMSDEVPDSATPRSITVHVKGDLTRCMKPGDHVIITGMYLPQPVARRGRMQRHTMLQNTVLVAAQVDQLKESYAEHVITDEDRGMVHELLTEGRVYSRLASSIAPEIWGHDDIKKVLLLQMVGGTSLALPDGIKIRGDMHVCLMGDPGVAKSQLLKHIGHISPRAVYTTGKGSSGVGLTASVQRDPTTGDFVLEGGALVLADRGICAIDEFDKMEESDRTAIHEVMEQQTVSIAKAGIMTTLNTRTAVLAAANPAWGRYDIRRSPAENIALPAALLSRFDILWLILDRANEDNDRQLADHVLSVHQLGYAPQPESEHPPLTPAQLRAYVAMAKQHEPKLPRELTEYVSAVYAELRRQESQSDRPHTYTTARSLLSILRLSQALAKLRFDNNVIQGDVEEALRLMSMSKISLEDEDQRSAAKCDPIAEAFSKVKEHIVRTECSEISWKELCTICHGTPPELVKQMVTEYQSYDVWSIEHDANGQVRLFVENMG